MEWAKDPKALHREVAERERKRVGRRAGGHAEGELAPAVWGSSWFFEIPPALDASQMQQELNIQIPWVLLDAARKYCFIPPKKPLIFLRVLLNVETSRGKVYIGKDIPSPSSHTTDHIYADSKGRLHRLSGHWMCLNTLPRLLWLTEFTGNKHFAKNVQESIKSGAHQVIAVFPACWLWGCF